ncbi:GNAT family N-acetyltransferase [Amedibacillus sp. YH-ame6]
MVSVVDNSLNENIYRHLRSKVNFKEYSDEDVTIAIENSLYTVVVYDEEVPIGMARLVGDDRVCFFLKDVVVDPLYQKLKIGKMIMEHLFAYIDTKACDGAYIGLLSTPTCVSFYEKFGFLERPCENMGPGMIKFYEKKR